ncbi:MAG: ADP-glyceromanno-heptose 6-epimerase [Gammaproteobacteria bacterium]
MIIVTGGAVFIGSNIVAYLNAHTGEDVLVVDDLTDGTKYRNLVDATICDYLDKDDFLRRIQQNESFGQLRAIIHQGACSATTEWDGKYMMDVNYNYSCALLEYCQRHKIPLIYASSAAVYGGSDTFVERPEHEKPLNVYGYSKLLFDQKVRRDMASATAQIAGLRYFNVYGPNEHHKGSMASVAYHFSNQLLDGGVCRLFEGHDGFRSGEQRRDFVYVDDICKVVGWLLENPQTSGVFNAGTGRSQTFNDVAQAVIKWHGRGQVQYVPFPEHLVGRYQSFTEADLSLLRQAGYTGEFVDVETGTHSYLDRLAGGTDSQ